MDILLERFLDGGYDTLSSIDCERFEAMLELPDQDLYGWIVGQFVPSEEYADLVAIIRSHVDVE